MLKKFDETTKQYKLFKALVINGESLTEAAIEKRFGIKNPTATISVIRQRGYAVYANPRLKHLSSSRKRNQPRFRK